MYVMYLCTYDPTARMRAFFCFLLQQPYWIRDTVEGARTINTEIIVLPVHYLGNSYYLLRQFPTANGGTMGCQSRNIERPEPGATYGLT